MTEAEWMECTDPQKMLESLPLLQRVGRKKYLFGAAICRTIDGMFSEEDERAESARLLESFAEGWPGKWAADRAIALMRNLLDKEVIVYEKSELVWMLSVLRCIFGNPFRPISINPAWLTWHDGLLVSLAQRMYDSRDFSDMPVLADALEEAGCDNADLLAHCRQTGEHVRGCWVVDLILGKE
jgi:hypothetical protein